jgi:hypothetical protein
MNVYVNVLLGVDEMNVYVKGNRSIDIWEIYIL